MNSKILLAVLLILVLSVGCAGRNRNRDIPVDQPDGVPEANNTPADNITIPAPLPRINFTGSLCDGLVTDMLDHPAANIPKPALLAPLADAMGGKIIRITDVALSEGENAIIIPMYSTVQAWNADESRMILWHRGAGHELYDGKTYGFIRKLDVSPTDIEQILWDPKDPDILYYPSNYNAVPDLYRYNVSSGTKEVLRNFADICPTGDWGKLLTLGNDPMYMSQNKIIGMRCGETKFLYDIVNDKVLGTLTASTSNAPQPGPSGTTAYLDGTVYDVSLKPLRTLNMKNPTEHASIGSGAHDVFNTVVFDVPSGGSEAEDVGTLVSFDMQTGERKVIIGKANGYPYPPSSTHISSIAYKAPGWSAVSVVGNPQSTSLLNGELLLANVDTGTVCRVAHHRSWAGEGGQWGYWAEPHVTISPSGTRLLFGSDWNNGPSVDAYVVELPSYNKV